MSIDLAAILTIAMHEMNQIRMNSMKPKFGSLAKLVNDVPLNAPLLCGSEEDINNNITKVMATNSAMGKRMRGNLKTSRLPKLLPLSDEGSEMRKSSGRSYILESKQEAKLQKAQLVYTVIDAFDIKLHLDVAKLEYCIKKYTAGNRKTFSSNWEEISPNSYIMQIFKQGLTIDFIDNTLPISNDIKRCTFAGMRLLSLIKKLINCSTKGL